MYDRCIQESVTSDVDIRTKENTEISVWVQVK